MQDLLYSKYTLLIKMQNPQGPFDRVPWLIEVGSVVQVYLTKGKMGDRWLVLDSPSRRD